jgi:hypothetical protein
VRQAAYAAIAPSAAWTNSSALDRADRLREQPRRDGLYSDIFNDLFGLWTVSPDGSGAQRFFLDGWLPAWSPDSSQFAILTFSGIEVVDADGSGGRLQVAGRDISNVDWAPGGSLVYGRWITASHDGPSRIFISDGHERQLIPDVTAPARQVYRDWQVVWRR